MARIDTDILVVGGGIAGLTAAALFAASGRSTLCIDAARPTTDVADPAADLRTTALLTPTVEALERAGAWAGMAPHAAPLHVMRLIDAGGPEPAARETADFVSSEVQDGPFGWNVPNTAIRRALLDRLDALETAEFRAPAGFKRLTLREGEAIASLSDGAQARARLVVAADGRDSAAREFAGIAARRWSYAQKALVFAVAHEAPHDGVSTEIHRTGGPFTLVPLPDGDGPRSSVVWMETGPRAAELLAMDEASFEEALNIRSCGVLGRLRVVSRVATWPMISQIAERLDGPRVALMGEAAHVIPPIGAQGLNMSAQDAAALVWMTEGAEDPGAPELLARYHRARWPDVAARVAGVDALNRAALTEAQPLRDLRRLGLRAIHGIVPVRRAAMRLGLGAGVG